MRGRGMQKEEDAEGGVMRGRGMYVGGCKEDIRERSLYPFDFCSDLQATIWLQILPQITQTLEITEKVRHGGTCNTHFHNFHIMSKII